MNDKIKTIEFDVSAAENFAAHIQNNKIKQADIVKATGYSKVYVSYILNGKVPITDTFRLKLNAYLSTSF